MMQPSRYRSRQSQRRNARNVNVGISELVGGDGRGVESVLYGHLSGDDDCANTLVAGYTSKE